MLNVKGSKEVKVNGKGETVVFAEGLCQDATRRYDKWQDKFQEQMMAEVKSKKFRMKGFRMPDYPKGFDQDDDFLLIGKEVRVLYVDDAFAVYRGGERSSEIFTDWDDAEEYYREFVYPDLQEQMEEELGRELSDDEWYDLPDNYGCCVQQVLDRQTRWVYPDYKDDEGWVSEGF